MARTSVEFLLGQRSSLSIRKSVARFQFVKSTLHDAFVETKQTRVPGNSVGRPRKLFEKE